MKICLAASREFVPASHENPLSPGVWKKVLAVKDDFQAGHVQMINWARLPVGSRFAAHYHEDMQEMFILVQGVAEMVVDSETITLRRGDAVLIEPHEVHSMRNGAGEEVEYVVVGVASGKNGRTIVVS
jgi:mannose-6-phosphate isomerase-like protein (cupin superfamily)